MEEYDVAIIGYGPTGATLAHLLADTGLKVLVLDRESKHYHLPRAIHFDAEVMRTFQWIGIADEIEPRTATHPGMRFVDAEGKLLLDWPRPQGEGPQAWRANFRFHQPDLEEVLRKRMKLRHQVTTRTRCEAFHVDDLGNKVELRFEDMSAGVVERVRAKFVVGCDGARSLVRRFIESEMEDYGFQERWLVIDVILNQNKPELGEHTIQYCVPGRPATYVRTPGLRRRWEITVLPEENSDEMIKHEQVWNLLSDWLKPEEAELERTAVYVFHSLLAKDWRKGRLIIAGDACHQTPPFMGQGMCAGIRDVANLYWKLALICKDIVASEEADTLLNSYETERKSNAREYIQTAVRLGGLINTAGTEEALRAALPSRNGSARMESIAPPLGPGLGIGKNSGLLFGQPRMSDGTRMDDVFCHQWVVVCDKILADDLELPAGVGLVTSENSNAAEHLAKMATRATILRPDRYTIGTAETTQELKELIASILPYSKFNKQKEKA